MKDKSVCIAFEPWNEWAAGKSDCIAVFDGLDQMLNSLFEIKM